MNCLTCEHYNRNTAKFCEGCGATMARRCTRCQAPLRVSAKFCDECGHSANTSSPQDNATSVVPAAANLHAIRTPLVYTPKHPADKILQSRSALEGARKQVTVLFADVKGSMELAEQLDPEESSPTADS